MAGIATCKDCEERSATCHGSCERYLAARQKHIDEKNAKTKELQHDEDYVNYVFGRKSKVINRRHLSSGKGRTKYGQT